MLWLRSKPMSPKQAGPSLWVKCEHSRLTLAARRKIRVRFILSLTGLAKPRLCWRYAIRRMVLVRGKSCLAPACQLGMTRPPMRPWRPGMGMCRLGCLPDRSPFIRRPGHLPFLVWMAKCMIHKVIFRIPFWPEVSLHACECHK